MYSSPEDIKAAIDAYRSHIAGHNRRILEVYVPFIIQMELEPEEIESIDGDMKVECFGSVLGVHLEEFISKPEDVLTRYDEFAPLCDLDGCGGPPPTRKEDKANLDSYFDILERSLKEKCLEEVQDTITIPEEFYIMATQVAALTGPGLTANYKSRYEYGIFWRGPETGPDAEKSIAESVKTPDQLNNELVGYPWECGAGWDPAGDSWIVAAFCRRDSPPGTDAQPWAWRYISSTHGLVFETMPDLLAWYCTFRGQEIPDVENLDEVEAISGNFV